MKGYYLPSYNEKVIVFELLTVFSWFVMEITLLNPSKMTFYL